MYRGYRWSTAISVFVFAVMCVLPLNTEAALYAPGTTLDPACAPTDPNCGIATSSQVTIATLSATTSLPAITTLSHLSTISTSLTGFIKATAGVLTTALINLASDVTGILPVANGGTGVKKIVSGLIPFGNGTGAIATSSKLVWDSTNIRLGVGTTSPYATFSLNGAAGGSSDLFVIATSSISYSTSTALRVGQNGNLYLPGGNGLNIGYGRTTPPGSGIIALGNVGIGTSSPAYPLTVKGTIQGSIQDAGGQVYNARAYGMKCDGTTDDTNAFNALLAQIIPNGVGGGTIWLPGVCRINGAVLFPNDGAPNPKQGYVRITGSGASGNGYWTSLPASPSGLDLRYSGGPKLDTRGAGILEVDHVTLEDGGNDCSPFIATTNTTLRVHDVAFSGTASQTSACNDAIVAGGTTPLYNGTPTGSFQGYGAVIENNFFDKIRRGVYGRVDFNGIVISDNTWSATCGSNLTTAVTSCTNANPTVCTVTGHGLTVGTTYSANFSGATGSWTAVNGAHAITPIDANTFSLPINTTSFGGLTGSLVYLSGAALEIDGTGGGGAPGRTTAGNVISGNLVELPYYPHFFVGTATLRNDFTDNELYDSNGTTISYYAFFGGSNYNEIKHGFANDTSALIAGDSTSARNTYTTSAQSQMSTWTEPWTFTNNNVQFANAQGQGPLITDTGGHQWWTSVKTSGQKLYWTANDSGSARDIAYLWDVSATQAELILNGSALDEVVAPSGADLKIFSGGGNSLWLGDPTNNIYINNGTINSPKTSGASLKLTNTGAVQWSSTSAVSGSADLGLTRNNAGILEVDSGTSGTYRDLRLRSLFSSGNSGLGTSTPYSRLTIWGPDTSANTAALTIANSASTTEFRVFDDGHAVLAGSLTQNSDERLKQNITPLDASSTLAKVVALSPVSFEWRDPDKEQGMQLGLIAQDVQQIFPNLVATTSATSVTPDGTLSLNYIGLISPIIEAIKEIASRIDGLRQSVTTAIVNATQQVNTPKLCLGSTCMNESQLKVLLQNVPSSPGSSTVTGDTSTTTPVDSGTVTNASSTPPTPITSDTSSGTTATSTPQQTTPDATSTATSTTTPNN